MKSSIRHSSTVSIPSLKTGKAYDLVLLIGQDHPAHVISYLKSELQRTGLQVEILTEDDSEDKVRSSFLLTSDHTQRCYMGHGEVKIDGSHAVKARIDYEPTGKVLTSYPGKGIDQLWSCNGGIAFEEVKRLGERRPLVIHSGRKYSTLILMNAENIVRQAVFHKAVMDHKKYGQDFPLSAADLFEFSLLTSPETLIYSELVNGKVESFKASAPQTEKDIKKPAKYLKNQLKAFREFRTKTLGHQKGQFLDFFHKKWNVINNDTMKRYTELSLMMEINRQDDKENLSYMKAYLKQKIHLQARLIDGTTPLAIAASNGTLDAMKLLLAHKADINALNHRGQTALFAACQSEQAEAAALLLSMQDIVTDQQDYLGRTPLYIAVQKSNFTLAEMLVSKGASIAKAAKDGKTPFWLAYESGNKLMAEILLGNKAKTHKSGITLLSEACKRGALDAVKLLLENGIDPNKADRSDIFPLERACLNADFHLARLLLQHHAHPGQETKEGKTPLWISCLNGDFATADLLLQYKADVNKEDKHGMTLIRYACINNDPILAEFLLQHGAIADQLYSDGTTLLTEVALHGTTSIAALLLDHKVDVNGKNRASMTPLGGAILQNNEAMIRLLLQRGANANLPTSHNGMKPLWLAAHQGNKAAVILLLEVDNIDLAAKHLGITAKEVALKQGYKDIARLLEKAEEERVQPKFSSFAEQILSAKRAAEATLM